MSGTPVENDAAKDIIESSSKTHLNRFWRKDNFPWTYDTSQTKIKMFKDTFLIFFHKTPTNYPKMTKKLKLLFENTISRK